MPLSMCPEYCTWGKSRQRKVIIGRQEGLECQYRSSGQEAKHERGGRPRGVEIDNRTSTLYEYPGKRGEKVPFQSLCRWRVVSIPRRQGPRAKMPKVQHFCRPSMKRPGRFPHPSQSSLPSRFFSFFPSPRPALCTGPEWGLREGLGLLTAPGWSSGNKCVMPAYLRQEGINSPGNTACGA